MKPKFARTLQRRMNGREMGGGQDMAHQDTTATLGQVDRDGVEVAMCTTCIRNRCGYSERTEDAVEEDPVRSQGRGERLDSLTEYIVDRHSERGVERRQGNR